MRSRWQIVVCWVTIYTLWGTCPVGGTVSSVRGRAGQPCEYPDGVAGRCEELSECLHSGGVAKRDGRVVLCQSSSARAVHVCCRRPHLIAQAMCNVWSEYWSSASRAQNSSCITEKPLIYGGEEAVLGEFPNMVSVGQWTELGLKWRCGGSLISPLFVLTAAHCIRWVLPTASGGCCPLHQVGAAHCIRSNHVVTLGEHDRSLPGIGALKRLNLGLPQGLAGEDLIASGAADFEAVEQVINVTEVFVYPEYQRRYHDIALLKLQRPASMTTRVLPACLPNSPVQHFSRQSSFVVAGWGATEEDPFGGSEKLMKVKIDYVESNLCWKRFNENPVFRPPWGITTDLICAGAENKDSCPGDSGGPLMQETDLPDMPGGGCRPRVVAGVVSFGPHCGQLGAYTRVASYLDWITSIVAPKALPPT
ncbi:Serine proteases trypsin domain [Trinorchestia longiramus]|nr:Serine proteases trypsin domain [Trinorchestia longiramus]